MVTKENIEREFSQDLERVKEDSQDRKKCANKKYFHIFIQINE